MVQLQLLGPAVLRRAGQALPLAIKKTQALLLLLALQPRGAALPRGRAAALLWPQLDETTGRRNLRRELARLREAGTSDAVQVEGDLLSLAAAVSCDLQRFRAECDAGRPDSAIECWLGPPADGLSLDDAPAFNDWWAPERERLLGLRRGALAASAAAHEARGDLAAALQRIDSLLADDPLQEQHHRNAMRLLAASGRREAALAQFERCTALLRSELGLAPMAETAALAAAERGADSSSAPLPAATERAQDLPDSPILQPPEQLPFVGRTARRPWCGACPVPTRHAAGGAGGRGCRSRVVARGFTSPAVLYCLCSVYANLTRPAQVLEVATRGWQMQPPLPVGGLRVMYRLGFVDAHHELGDLGAAWEHAAAALAEAGDLNEVYVQVSSLSTSLELVTLLGEQACADALQQSLSLDLLRQMPQHANDLWQARAKSALLLRDTAAATQALAQVTGDICIGRVALFNALVRAERALVQGEVAAALALLPPLQAEGMSEEFRLRTLALQVRACTQLQTPLGPALVDAMAAADAAAHLARLCASLHTHPAQQRALQHRTGSLSSICIGST